MNRRFPGGALSARGQGSGACGGLTKTAQQHIFLKIPNPIISPNLDTNRPSLLRDAVGFSVGGMVAAGSAGLVFVAFIPLPPSNPTDYTRAALAILLFVMFFCGGLIGRVAFNAEFWSDLLTLVIGSFIGIGLLCFISSLYVGEAAEMMGFASVGIFTSAAVLLILGRRFPAKIENYEDQE
jgi:hypothetical protein